MPRSFLPQSELICCQPDIPLQAEWFDPEFWKKRGELIGTASGRGTVWFVQGDYGAFVIRRYRRGGFMAKLTQFRFAFTGLQNTRPWKELALLEKMNKLNLPVPKPIGGRVSRFGPFYEAEIVTGTIEHADELFSRLQCTPSSSVNWQEIGRVINRFHQHGIYHSDLNCHNLMIDKDEKIWLIDFDKCDQRPVSHSWMEANLARLKRSLLKESSQNPEVQFEEQDWQTLLKGYHG